MPGASTGSAQAPAAGAMRQPDLPRGGNVNDVGHAGEMPERQHPAGGR